MLFKTVIFLLYNFIKWSRENFIKEIYLGTTLQFLAAHRFYEKNGFISIDLNDLPENFPVLQVDKKFYKYLVV